MTHRLTIIILTTPKIIVNRALIVQVILGNVVTCFFSGTQCSEGIVWLWYSLVVARSVSATDTFILNCVTLFSSLDIP